LRELESLMAGSGRNYKRSTIHEKLIGISQPSEEFVKAFVHACAVHAKAEIDPKPLLDLHRRMLLELGEFKDSKKEAKASTTQYRRDVVIEWTSEGPKVTGDRVLLAPAEMNALIDRWMEWLPEYVRQEEEALGKGSDEAFACGRFLAALQACYDTYRRVPNATEVGQLSTELARKYSAFWQFIEVLHIQIGLAGGTYDDALPFSEMFDLGTPED
jgi:hypothetical protein